MGKMYLRHLKGKSWLKSWSIAKTIDSSLNRFDWTKNKTEAYTFQIEEEIQYVIEKLKEQKIKCSIEKVKEKKSIKVDALRYLEPVLIVKLATLDIPPDLSAAKQREYISIVLKKDIIKAYPNDVSSKGKLNSIVHLCYSCWKFLHA